MTDKRVKEFNDEWFKCYQAKYTITPIWSEKDWGVNGKIAKNLWSWADKNKVSEMEMYNALHSFFEKDGPHSYEIYYKLVTEFVAKLRHGQKIVEKAKQIFAQSQENLEKRTQVLPKTDNDLFKTMSKLWKNNEEGCLQWAKGQRYTQKNLQGINDKDSLVYKNWVRNGQMARRYFGNELVDKCWKATAPMEPEAKKKLLLKQKEMLTKNIDSNNVKEENDVQTV